MLFSATMAPDIKSLIKEFTHDAAIHDVVGDEAPNDVDHYFWRVPRDQRPQITADIVEEYERAIIFTRTKHGADRLARQLEERGISAVPLHGDRTQAQRERALRSVKNGQIRVLVATDVAARGIHIELLPVVIHYDPPAQGDRLPCTVRAAPVAPARRVPSSRSWVRTSSVRSSVCRRRWASRCRIETREDATAVRLGAVDDVIASERLDDRGGKGRSERSTPRDHDRGPRNFERREPRERSSFERESRPVRSERPFADRGPRPARSPEDRTRGDRPVSARGANTDRPARSDRGFSDRTTRPERGFVRAARPERGSNDRTVRPERTNDRQAPRFNDRGTTPRGEKGKEAVVSFFNDSKGFGFASDDKGDDLFIHFSSIQGDGFKSLTQGQTITFEEATGPKGREARNVACGRWRSPAPIICANEKTRQRSYNVR
jgi:cold shock CspA family protein